MPEDLEKTDKIPVVSRSKQQQQQFPPEPPQSAYIPIGLAICLGGVILFSMIYFFATVLAFLHAH